MDSNELARLHQKDGIALEAIHGCVHDAACACCPGNDRLHQRIEVQLCEVSSDVTRAAQKHNRTPTDRL